MSDATAASSTRGFPWRLTMAFVGALVALIGLGYYTWQLRGDYKKVENAQNELSKTQATVAALEKELATCASARDDANKRCTEVEGSLEAMRKDLSATKVEMEHLRKQRAQVAKRLAAFKDLTAQFKKMIDSGQIDVSIRKGQMTVQLPAGVLFESGKAELSRAGELALMEVAVVLRKFSDRRFMVIGHTDDRPLEASATSRFKNNWELSTARAVTVVSFLIEAKMKAINLIAAGVGEFDPKAENNTPKGRQENRRIEIILMPNLAELPANDLATSSGEQLAPGRDSADR